MTDYKKYMLPCGVSDFAQLLFRFPNKAEIVNFGEDGDYKAWVVIDSEVEIPSHYTKVTEGNSWLDIIDDDRVVAHLSGERFEVYRAGLRGLLIRVIKPRDNGEIVPWIVA